VHAAAGGAAQDGWHVLAAFGPARQRRAHEQAIDQIVDAIRTGSLRIGDRMPTERALAAAMAISRASVREAIGRLVDAGILASRMRDGTYVVSDWVPAELITDRWEPRARDVTAALTARRTVEPRVAQLAAIHADESDYRGLEEIIDRLRDDRLSRTDILKLDLQFHLRVAQATRNPVLVSIMDIVMAQLMDILAGPLSDYRTEALVTPENRRWVVEGHEKILWTIMGRDPAQIEAVMDEHMSRLERAWRERSGRSLIHELPDFMRRGRLEP
jgi:GntR family transcriptional regulator, transcriptional repressor for pyruvate dehydrogenase complex